MIGICLGMQLMYEHSDEGDASGLGFIQEIFRVSKNTQCRRLENCIIMLNQDVYFVHSYQAPMSENVIVLGL